MTWKGWLYGLLAAVLGSAGNTLTMGAIDPQHFSLSSGDWKHIGAALAAGAVVAVGGYLKNRPIPDPPASGGGAK